MTNKWSNEIILDFINEVHLHPQLWDVRTTYNKVGEKFGVTSNQAYKKFRNLRTYANNEEKRKSSTDNIIQKWFAFDAISFALSSNFANIGINGETVAANVTETDAEIISDSCVVGKLETETSEDLHTGPHIKRSRTTDPLSGEAQNIASYDNSRKRSEYAAFGEHVAHKLSKYDDYTRSQAEFKIMQILFDSDMTMHRNRDQSPSGAQNLNVEHSSLPHDDDKKNGENGLLSVE